MNIRLKIFIFLLFILNFTSMFSQQKIRVQLKWKHQFQFAGYYAAKENGYYKRNGMNVEFLERDKENPVEAVLRGKAEFGIGNSEIVMEKAKGKKIVLLASIFQHSPYVFIAKKGIKNIHNMAEKRIAMESNATELLLYLKKEGIDLKKVNFAETDYSIMPLVENRAEAIAAYITDEPFQMKEKNMEFIIFNPLASGIDFYGDSIFTSEEFLKKNPEIVKKFVEESIKGWSYALDNKAEMVEIILAKYSQRHSREQLLYEAEETEKLIMPHMVTIGYVNEERWKKIEKMYEEIGIVPENSSIDGFFYKSKVEIDYSFIKNIVMVISIIVAVVVLIIIAVIIFNRKLQNEIVIKNKIAQKLKEKEKKYKLLAENTIECIWLISIADMKFKYISPAIYGLRGLTVEEAMKESVSDSLTPESLEKVNRITQIRKSRFLEGDRSQQTMEGTDEFQQYKKDGTVIDVEISTKYIYDEESKTLDVLGVTRDITERKRMEKKIKEEIEGKNTLIKKISESEKELKEFMVVIERMTAGFIITDINGTIKYVNKRVIDVTGFKKEDVIGKTPRIFNSGVQSLEFYKNMWQEITNGKEWHGEFINEKRNGERYKVRATIIPVKDETGEIYSYLALEELE